MAKRSVKTKGGGGPDQLDLVDWLAKNPVVTTVPTTTTTKRCSKCREVKAVELFSKRTGVKDGRQSECKACAAAYQKANRAKLAAQKADYRKANRAKLAAQKADYRKANRTKIAAQKASKHRSDPISTLACSARIRRPHDFSLSSEWIDAARAQATCPLTGLVFDQSREGKGRAPLGKSLDRFDSALGYTDDNTRVVCCWANSARGEASDAELIALCRLVLEYRDTQQKLAKCHMSYDERLKKVRARVESSRYLAKKKGVECTLTPEWAIEAAKQSHCAISGMAFASWKVEGRSGHDGDNISLDRIDSSKGYTPDNVQLVRQRFNRLKGELTMTELYAMCEAVVRTADRNKKER